MIRENSTQHGSSGARVADTSALLDVPKADPTAQKCQVSSKEGGSLAILGPESRVAG
jgi:hypothetical protein